MNFSTDTILEFENVNFRIGRGKKAFFLNDISFAVRRGNVTGLIGENGAGKTTLLRLALNLYVQNSGSISLFGKKDCRANIEARDKIGFVISDAFLPFFHTAQTAGTFLSNVYSNWDSNVYEKYMHDFKIPVSKRLYSLSSGTLQKLQIAIALSHNAELLILDEPLNYLDPVFKKRFLEILQEFMKDEKHAVLISSHQTSDLEKICDDVLFISGGKMIFSDSMENLNGTYGILKTDEKNFRSLSAHDYIGYRNTKYAYEILTAHKTSEKFSGMVCEDASLEDIMYFYSTKGDN